MKLSKFVWLLGAFVFILVGCNSNENPIEEPTDGSSQIESNNNLIFTYEERWEEEKKKHDDAELQDVKNAYAETMVFWERSIQRLENENELLENTLFYTDDFKVVDGVGIYTDLNESILNEETLISGFNNSSIKVLEKYNSVITNGAILISAAPFEEEGDKYALISVFFSQENLDNIDFSESEDDDVSDFIYRKADYVKANNNLSDYLESGGDFDVTTELFTHYSGKVY